MYTSQNYHQISSSETAFQNFPHFDFRLGSHKPGHFANDDDEFLSTYKKHLQWNREVLTLFTANNGKNKERTITANSEQ